jgi:hypothetical protein
MIGNFHEKLSPRSVEIGSNRSFGVVMGAACLVFSVIGFWAGSVYWPILTGAAAAFGSAALLWPGLLSPLNRVWFWFGLTLHKILNPVVMGVLFFGVIMPIGAIMRLNGKRPLKCEFETGKTSYWTQRNNALQSGSMTKQF